jgi:hypothetical protein
MGPGKLSTESFTRPHLLEGKIHLLHRHRLLAIGIGSQIRYANGNQSRANEIGGGQRAERHVGYRGEPVGRKKYGRKTASRSCRERLRPSSGGRGGGLVVVSRAGKFTTVQESGKRWFVWRRCQLACDTFYLLIARYRAQKVSRLIDISIKSPACHAGAL